MHQELADKLAANKPLWLDIEKQTGVTSTTIRAIIKNPNAPRHRVVIYALDMFFKKAKIK